MTVSWISGTSGQFNDYKQCIIHLDDGSVVDVLNAHIYEFADGYKVYDDTLKKITILWKLKVKKIELRPDNYEWFKQDKINEMKEKWEKKAKK